MDILVAVLLIVALFALLGSGVWIGLALAGVAWIGMILFSTRPAGDAMAVTIWGTASSWTLTALPLFVWMGEILFRTRLSEDMFRGLAPWLERVPGRLLFIAVLAALCLLWWQVSGTRQGLRILLWAAFAWWCVATLWIIAGLRATRLHVACGGLLALSFAWLALWRMRVDWDHGQYAVLYALLIVWLADSGAYFSGRLWGTTRLAPAISPGKTWAGLWGGLAVCALLALGVAAWRELPWLPLLAVTLVAGVYSVVGDLTESLAKRFAGVKDRNAKAATDSPSRRNGTRNAER